MTEEVDIVDECPPPPTYYKLFTNENALDAPPVSDPEQQYNGILKNQLNKMKFDSSKNYKQILIRYITILSYNRVKLQYINSTRMKFQHVRDVFLYKTRFLNKYFMCISSHFYDFYRLLNELLKESVRVASRMPENVPTMQRFSGINNYINEIINTLNEYRSHEARYNLLKLLESDVTRIKILESEMTE
jgi:hypothetical protein